MIRPEEWMMLKWFRRKKQEEPVESAQAPEAPAAAEPASTDEGPSDQLLHDQPIPDDLQRDEPATLGEFSPADAEQMEWIAPTESTPVELDAAALSVEMERDAFRSDAEATETEASGVSPFEREADETDSVEAVAAEEPAPEPAPEKKRGFFLRLRDRLGKTRSSLVEAVRGAVRLRGKVDETLLEEIEEILIQSDVGVQTTTRIVDQMRKAARRQGALSPDELLALFKAEIERILTENNRPLEFDRARPMIVLVVGVNGTGKTTTIGKIGKVLADQGKRVMMVAADTFRAAAADQLQVWAERTGSCIVRQSEGADPASVVYEALEGARRDTPDVILIDTAGRLHTKTHLMEELSKIGRVIRKHYPEAPHETVLVLDATTGQNALNQLRLFNDACQLTGLIMTKLDGTAKGGILIACKDALNLPIFKIGIGESAEDLRDFDAHDFAEALFGGGNGADGA